MFICLANLPELARGHIHRDEEDGAGWRGIKIKAVKALVSLIMWQVKGCCKHAKTSARIPTCSLQSGAFQLVTHSWTHDATRTADTHNKAATMLQQFL